MPYSDSKRIRKELRHQARHANKFSQQQTYDKPYIVTTGPSNALHIETSQQKLVALLLFSSVLLSFASSSAEVIPVQFEKEELDNKSLMYNYINSTCSNSVFVPDNKPHNIRLDAADGTRMPTSCVDHFRHSVPVTKTCERDAKIFNDFFGVARMDHPKLVEARATLKKSVANIFENIVALNYFTSEQHSKFFQYARVLERLEAFDQMVKYTKKIKMGNCEEHLAHTTMSIFKAVKKYNFFPTLQEVELKSEDGQAHLYSLINSDINDVEIKNNPSEIKNLLHNLKKGYICDSWNKGYYEELSKNKNEFYEINWNSIKIHTLSIDFDVSDLPQAAAGFVTQKLKELKMSHLLKTDKPACKLEL